jgi:hypothetical protein
MRRLLRSPHRGAALLSTALIAVLVTATVYVVHPWPRHGVDQIRHLVDWPRDCESITATVPYGAPWRQAEQDIFIECQFMGPAVEYARFKDRRALKADLLAASPDRAVCIYGGGTEVAVDELDPGQFAALCQQLHGDLIDGLARSPQISGDVIETPTGPLIVHQPLRDRRAEHQALVEYFRSAFYR